MKEKAEVVFTKEQILTSKRYANRKDLVHAIVTKDESISESELTKRIENFMKGKVD